MSQGLLLEASKSRKCPSQERATLKYSKEELQKQKEKIKLIRKTGRELSNDKLYTVNFYPVSEWRHQWRTPFSVIKKYGAGKRSPPHLTLNRE